MNAESAPKSAPEPFPTGILADVYAEDGLLGMVIDRPEIAAMLVEALSPPDFQDPTNRAVFTAIAKNIDLGTVPTTANILVHAKSVLLNDLVAKQANSMSFSQVLFDGFVADLKKISARREAVRFGEDLQRRALDPAVGLTELTSEIAAAGERIRQRASSDGLCASSDSYLKSELASEVVPTKPRWLWKGWLGWGFLILLIGRQSGGKSTLAAFLVARFSNGRTPEGGTLDGPVNCGMLSLEEGADRQVARLRSAGACLERVSILGLIVDIDKDGQPFERPWRLPEDVARLETLIIERSFGVVVIDGLGYSINGDSHNYANVGAALSALAGVADRTGCAILGLTHPPKGASDPVTAAIGSTAWTAIPRICWVLGIDPGDESGSRRVVRVSKTNFREPSHGLEFSIDNNDEFEVGYICNVKDSAVEAFELTSPSDPEKRGKSKEAKDWLVETLSEGRMLAKDVEVLADAEGISRATLRRVRETLVDVKREGYPSVSYWFLKVPNTLVQPEKASGYGENGHLWSDQAEQPKNSLNPPTLAHLRGMSMCEEDGQVWPEAPPLTDDEIDGFSSLDEEVL